MTCRTCGASIADKAIACYRCGAPTADLPSVSSTPGGSVRRGPSWALVVLLLAVAGVMGWLAMVSETGSGSQIFHAVLGAVAAALAGHFARSRGR